jgi:integrase
MRDNIASGGYVYVIGDEAPPYKVGWSRSAARRLIAIQTGNPRRIKILHVVPHEHARAVEWQAHRLLGSARISGEWFDASLFRIKQAIGTARAMIDGQKDGDFEAKEQPENQHDKGSYRASDDVGFFPASVDVLALNRGLPDGVDPADLAGAFSLATRRAYAGDWKLWATWCAVNGKTALPAKPADLASWMKERAHTRKMTSVSRGLAAVAKIHELAGAPINKYDPALHFAMARLARERGQSKDGRHALSTADIEAMLRPLGSDLLGLRDRAIILLGFAGGFRRSELVALEIADINWRRDGITILIKRSKGDQEGEGQTVGILYGRRERTCPVRALKRWIEASGLAEGVIFRRVKGSGIAAALTDQVIWRVVKRHAAAAGLDPSNLGAHSLRVGHVTQALENGADPVKAKEQLRHKKLDTTLGYNRSASTLKPGNTSGKLGL